MALGKNVKKKPDQTSSQSEGKANDDVQELVKQAEETGKLDISIPEKEEEQIEDKFLNQYCIFQAGKEEYAVPIDVVKEVVKYTTPAPIPQMPSYIIGMSNIRGNIYGVLDLELFFQGSIKEETHQYLLVLDHDVYKMAIRIKDVPNSLMVSEEMIEQITSSTFKSVVGQKYLKGIIKKDKRMIVLFDILGMVASDKFVEIN